MYGTILACSLLIRLKPETTVPATIIAFAISLSGSVYALYLTWIEVAVIEAICQWCVASAALTLLLTLLQGILLWRAFSAPTSLSGETETGDAAY